MALVAAGCGVSATRLAASWAEFLCRLEPLGEVMALTRNALAVHEWHTGYACDLESELCARVRRGSSELRLWLDRWPRGLRFLNRVRPANAAAYSFSMERVS